MADRSSLLIFCVRMLQSDPMLLLRRGLFVGALKRSVELGMLLSGFS